MREWRRTTGVVVRRRVAERALAHAREPVGGRGCAGERRRVHAQSGYGSGTARSSVCACTAPARVPPARRWPATEGNTACTSSGSTIGRAGDQRVRARRGEQHEAGARAQAAPRAGVAVAVAVRRVAARWRRAAPARSRAAPGATWMSAASRCQSASVAGSASGGVSPMRARRSPPRADRARRRDRDSRARWPSGSGRAATRAAGTRRSARSGFCVAMTKNGSGSLRVWPSIDTCRSSIASSSALCVLGGARLISSASTTELKIGPAWKRNAWLRSS